VPLHDLVSSLEGAQELYARARPPYPPEVIEALVTGIGVEPGARVLDLGAGTGLLTRPLIAAGYDVVAVEPLDGMRSSLGAVAGAENVLAGTAEAIPLPAQSVDAIVCGDAYHWFDPDRAPAELHRVLRPGGGVGLAWRWPDSADEEHWVRRLVRLLAEVRPEHPGFTEDRGTDGLARHGGFEPVRRRRLTVAFTTDAAGLGEYISSLTYVASLPSERREQLLASVRSLVGEAGQPVELPMFADVWLTRRR
jgi:SAM-dependent methyltransferase